MPAWAWRDAQGKWHDAILDVEARQPGSTVAHQFDLAFVNTQAKRYDNEWPSSALSAEVARKFGRYGPAVCPLVAALRGRWSDEALHSLRLLASRAFPLARVQPARLVRKLARAVACGIAVAEARARISILGGSACTVRLNNRVEHLAGSREQSYE